MGTSFAPPDNPEASAAANLRALFSAPAFAAFTVSPAGLITSWSTGAREFLGYGETEVLTRHMGGLLAPERHQDLQAPLRQLEDGRPPEALETVFLHASGRRVHACAHFVGWWPEHPAGEKGALIVLRDLSERHRLHGELAGVQATHQHRSIVLETANRVALDILASRSGLEALRHIADAARVLAGARYAALGVANLDGNGLSEFITTGLTPEEEIAIGNRPRGLGILGLLLHRSKPLRIDDLGAHPSSAGFPPGHPHMKSFLGVPIRRGEIIIGSLYLTNKQGGGTFTEGDEVAVEALGAHAAVAINNLHMLMRQRALVSSLITAQEEERRAVAYDLHDGLTQYVMASHAHLESFRKAHAAGDEKRANTQMDHGMRYLKEAVVESRRLVNGLRSLALDDLGLTGALEQLLTEEKSRADWADAEWITDLGDLRFDKSLETAVYRVAQEALTNVRKHAATEMVLLRLQFRQEVSGPVLELEVRDWGRGFRLGETDPERVGLTGMSERVHLLGGKLSLRTAPGEGTRVEAVFPANPLAPELGEVPPLPPLG